MEEGDNVRRRERMCGGGREGMEEGENVWRRGRRYGGGGEGTEGGENVKWGVKMYGVAREYRPELKKMWRKAQR